MNVELDKPLRQTLPNKKNETRHMNKLWRSPYAHVHCKVDSFEDESNEIKVDACCKSNFVCLTRIVKTNFTTSLNQKKI